MNTSLMSIELFVDGKCVRLWNMDYTFGPLDKMDIRIKELILDKKILECKCDAAPMICENPYEIYVVVKSRLRTDNIDSQEWTDFCLKVAKNKNSSPFKLKIAI